MNGKDARKAVEKEIEKHKLSLIKSNVEIRVAQRKKKKK